MLTKPTIVALVAFCSVLAAQNALAVWEYIHTPFTGTAAIYGGFLDEARVPTPGDTKIAFNLTGKSAKEMFDAIGPDQKGGCSAPGLRVRQKDMLLCRYRPKDGYWCNFGFDLSTGLSIGGSIGGAACQSN
jgi:hypothetical protein